VPFYLKNKAQGPYRTCLWYNLLGFGISHR
jgi:hypothetical protein